MIKKTLVLSLVSHGHADEVLTLLREITCVTDKVPDRVILTLNIPEEAPAPPPGGWSFRFDVIHNATPLGFGANHNKALMNAPEDFIGIINPDIKLQHSGNPFNILMATAAATGVGCAYPRQVNVSGALQDSERSLPTPAALLKRWIFRRTETRVSWINAACLVIPRAVWQKTAGFDERYFMYCEDVDLCLRIQLLGYSLRRAPCTIIHEGNRASHRNAKHLYWHVQSLLRLWRSKSYHDYKKMMD